MDIAEEAIKKKLSSFLINIKFNQVNTIMRV